MKNRNFLIYHPALGYFAQDYNLDMIPVEKEGKEASAKRLQDIIEKTRDQNIKAVFYQAEMAGQQIETLAQEINGKIIEIDPLASDYINNIKEIAELIKKY